MHKIDRLIMLIGTDHYVLLVIRNRLNTNTHIANKFNERNIELLSLSNKENVFFGEQI